MSHALVDTRFKCGCNITIIIIVVVLLLIIISIAMKMMGAEVVGGRTPGFHPPTQPNRLRWPILESTEREREKRRRAGLTEGWTTCKCKCKWARWCIVIVRGLDTWVTTLLVANGQDDALSLSVCRSWRAQREVWTTLLHDDRVEI